MKRMTFAAVALLLALSACIGGESPGNERSGDADLDREESLSMTDPLYRYDPPIEVSTVRSTDQAMKFVEGESLDDNIWTRIFEERYGIRVRNLWIVDSLQYAQKLNISIASGELPDFFLASKEEMKRLHEAGQLEDLSGLLQQYGSPFLKELLRQDDGVSLQAATFDGKLAGLPKMMVNGGVSTAEMLWVRVDWLKKLGLPEPRTIDDVVDIATAFAKNDPDGNGIDDTSGLGVNNELFLYHGSLKGFFNGFGAYPEIWIEDSDGRLVFGSIQPEMKTALARLRNMYAAGVIDPEFAVKPWTKLTEEIASGKLGLAYGSVSDGGYIHKVNVDNDPNAEWKPYPIASADGAPAKPQLMDAADSFYVVKKGARHPEAMIKLANIYLRHFYEINYAPEPNPFVSSPDGIFPGRYQPVTIDPLTVNLEAYRQVQEALSSGEGDGLPFPASLHYDRLTQYFAGDRDMWFSSAVFGPEGSYSVIDAYDNSGGGRFNAFQGAATPTMVERLAPLLRLQDETFTRIIMGEGPLEQFDRYVEEWRRFGGDRMTEEVNRWASQPHNNDR
ncbi:extracellular solute-binding protein [Paenibacillus antri]|uniref:Extracellular solute-binding protein n=1 Tax=Paenibacillus antri TaxID=2582848 RepID=A0A5R9GJN4_9BACL|nr:extracellular solute-binding protein [Paenibacillus antri]TLS53658.1 extracellular solute-binding protein [Paenibacillus antri]